MKQRLIILLSAGLACAAIAAERPPLVAPLGDGLSLLDATPGTGQAIVGFGPGMQAGADEIIVDQCPNGGWNWPHGGCEATYSNITGPIGLGLLHAWNSTGDPDHLAAAVAGGNYDLTDAYENGEARFGTLTPYWLWQLSLQTGNSTFAQHVEEAFFDALSAGTYGPSDYTTAAYIASVQAGRSGTWINLRSWEFSMLIPAASALGDAGQVSEFIAACLAGLDTLDNTAPATVYSDILGVTGGVRGLALGNVVSFTPINSPNHAGVNGLDTLVELADYLASLQNADGSWYWHSDLALVGGATESDEDTQTTAYAVLALLAADPLVASDYSINVAQGRDWLRGMQLPDGGFLSYPGGSQNIEVEGEALNALAPDGCTQNRLVFEVPTGSRCVKSGDTVTVELWQRDLQQLVRGVQVFAQFDAGTMTYASGSYTASPYGVPVINPIAVSGNDIDMASGIDDFGGQLPTQADALLATFTFTAGATEGPTVVSFRLHDPPSRFTGEAGGEVLPCLVPSPTILIDNTAPVITCPSDRVVECVEQTQPDDAGYATATDNLDDSVEITFSDVSSGTPCALTISRTWTATDCAGNSSSCVQTITVADLTPPALTCAEPPALVVNTDPGACEALVDPEALAVTATDNCVAPVVITYVRSDNAALDLGDPYPLGTTTITWTATDACGLTDTCIRTVTVNDGEAPVISGLTATGEALVAECEYQVNFSANVADNCCLEPADIVVDVALLTGNATLGIPTIQTEPSTGGFAVTGSVSVSGLTSCPATVRVVVFAADCAGNQAGADAGAPTPGMWTESFLGGGPGLPGNVVEAWDTAPGVTWHLAGPTLENVTLVEDTVSDGNGVRVYDSLYTGGTLTYNGNTANVVSHRHLTTQVWVDGAVDWNASFTDIITHAVADGISGYTVTGRALFVGQGAAAPPEYPAVQGASGGHWGSIAQMRVAQPELASADVTDSSAPAITCPPDIAIECSDSLLPDDIGSATATDNCTAGPTISYYDSPPRFVLTAPAGWSFYSANTASGGPVAGPDAPPVGVGSFQMLTGAGDGPGLGGQLFLGTRAHSGTPLNALTTFSYSTYVAPTSPTSDLATAVRMQVDLDGDGLRDTTLFFEPVRVPDQGPVASGVWQTWDMLSGDGWGYTTSFGVLTAPGQEFKSLAYYFGLYPSAQVVDWDLTPGLQCVAGSPDGASWVNFDGNVDNVVVNAAAYDFEPEMLGCYPRLLERLWVAADSCGNSSACVQSITIDDTSPPTLEAPADIEISADAGLCTGTPADLGTPLLSDLCDASPALVAVRSDGLPLGDPYPPGVTTLTWTATDCAGHSALDTQTVTVNAYNELLASVQLDTNFTGSRCITFELWDCTPPVYGPLEFKQELNFVDGAAVGELLLVPCGVYTCVTARDELHTLRRTLAPIIAGTQWVAGFTGSEAFVSGNLNDDRWIDILDFGVFSWQYGTTPGADTACDTPYPHADLNGDGVVTTLEFSFIQINFLDASEAGCCKSLGLLSESGPVTRIDVAELAALGLAELAAGDVNGDGWLDEGDLAAFAGGLGTPLVGDANCDGSVDFSDINAFVQAISDLAEWQQAHPGCNALNADANGDGAVNFADINAFVALLTSGQ